MKNIKLKFLALIIVLGAITVACSLDSDSNTNCYSSGYAFTNAVTGPDSTRVNVPITINVSFKLENSCGTFNRLVETNGYPKDIAPYVEYTGCNCTTVDVPLIKPYIFTAPAAGTYSLRFQKDATPTFITKTIVVTAQ